MTKPVCACYSESMYERERERDGEAHQSKRSATALTTFSDKVRDSGFIEQTQAAGSLKKALEINLSKLVSL